jgi:hypothetical protein
MMPPMPLEGKQSNACLDFVSNRVCPRKNSVLVIATNSPENLQPAVILPSNFPTLSPVKSATLTGPNTGA